MDYTILEHIAVDELKEPTRCIDFLIGKFHMYPTRNSLKKAIGRNEILVNGKFASTGLWLNEGDQIELLESLRKAPKELDYHIPIVYEDEYLIVVNKPPGLLTSGNHYDTLVNAMVGKGELSNASDAWAWFRPLHRLDRATGGLVMMSKTASVHRALADQFENRAIEKVYHAIVKGGFPLEGTIDTEVDGKNAQTDFRTVQKVESVKSGEISLVELLPKTGRTHQLRIHCSEIGYPIIGDKLYDESKNTLSHKGLFLVATGLKFVHPRTQKELNLRIDLPAKFISLLDREKRWFERVQKS
ncbi:MAG: RluA family pseudouridine synthase [Crocinitomicaceae bacterium]